MQEEQGQKRIVVFSLVIIIALGTALRLYHLGGQSLWYDEIVSASWAKNSIPWILQLQNTQGRPVSYLLIHFFLGLSQSEWAVRLPSAIAGILAIPLIFGVATTLFGRREGLISAFLLSVSPFHVRESQEARFYALMVLLSLLTLLFLIKALQDNRKKFWLAFALSTILNIYNQAFGFFVLVSETMLVLFVLMGKRFANRKERMGIGLVQSRNSGDVGKEKPFKVGGFLPSLSLLTTVVCTMPALLFLLGSPEGKSVAVSRDDIEQWLRGGEITRGLALSPRFFVNLFERLGAGGGFALVLFVAFFLIGLIALVKRQKSTLFLALSWVITPFIVIFGGPILLSKRPAHFFTIKYLIFILPLYLIVISRGITTLADGIDARASALMTSVRAGSGPRTVALAAMIVAFGIACVEPLQAHYQSEKTHWKAAAAFLEEHSLPGDMITVIENRSNISLSYYWELNSWLRNNSTFIRVRSLAELGRALSEHDRVWLVTYAKRAPTDMVDWADQYFTKAKIPWTGQPTIFLNDDNSLYRSHIEADAFTKSDGASPESINSGDGVVMGLKEGGFLEYEHLFIESARYLLTANVFSGLGDEPQLEIRLDDMLVGTLSRGAPEGDWCAESLVVEVKEPGLRHLRLACVGNGSRGADGRILVGSLEIRGAEDFYELGKSHYQSKQYDEAASHYEMAVALNPEHIRAPIGLGDTYRKLHRPDEALYWYERALGLSPKNRLAHYGLGWTYSGLERYHESIAHFERANESQPGNKWTYFGLGQCYRQLGDCGKAIYWYRKALDRDSNFVDAAEGLEACGAN